MGVIDKKTETHTVEDNRLWREMTADEILASMERALFPDGRPEPEAKPSWQSMLKRKLMTGLGLR